MGNKTTLKKTGAKRRALIRKAEAALLTRSATVQNRLLALFLNELVNVVDIRGGRFVASVDSLQKFEASTFLQKFFKDVATPTLRKLFTKAFGDINQQASVYFGRFKNPRFDDVQKIIFSQLAEVAGISPEAIKAGTGFVPKLLSNKTIEREVRAVAIRAITSGTSIAEFRDVARTAIAGTSQKMGIVESHYYTHAHDSFAEYDRTVQNNFAAALDLNYAIYAGGEMKTTREFCIHRNGKVYNREEILSWNSLDWQGKKEGNNILIDAGGYNCRHYFDWISWQLAKQLKPSIQRSLFDVQLKKQNDG